MAATLEAATDTDPLFGEGGSPVDPAVLLAPSAGKTARISVISMIGLPDEARQSFVSRLQIALFAYFRANPVRDRPLGGLLVMDEAQIFVPAGAATPSAESTRTLIAQVRKYGLGMLLATQMPKGLHNSVPGNTVNQFIGRLTAPAQLGAAEQMAQARGSTLDNVGKLGSGVFYAATEGSSFSRIETPLCLSHHRDALSEEEVLERAQR
jgi:DNA helicase HerA-like ATPase